MVTCTPTLNSCLWVQGCTRVTVIATAVRVCIESCHECTFYLGVNRPPLLVGVNRFIQVGMLTPSSSSHHKALNDWLQTTFSVS